MNAVHITPTRNLSSIMANGIYRSKPLLNQYVEVMTQDYGEKYDPERGMVWSFISDVHDQKFFKHFCYWKVWGTPRNIAIDKLDINDGANGNWDRIREIGPSVFKSFIPEQEHLTALLIDISDHPKYGKYIHCQNHDMNPQWNDMEERYEHDDMPMVLINYDVPPSCIKYQIGTAETVLSKAGKIDIMMTMKRKSL